MNEQKRLYIMGGLVLVLVLANVFVRFSEDGGSAMLFADIADMEAGWSPKLKRNMSEIENLPELSFRIRKEQTELDPDTRNPFIFGVDRELERTRQARIAELDQAREEMLAQAAEAEPLMENTEPAAPPPATFNGKIIGIMEDTKSDEMVLSVIWQDRYYPLRAGDTLEDQYRLISVSREHVRFIALKTDQEINITLETP